MLHQQQTWAGFLESPTCDQVCLFEPTCDQVRLFEPTCDQVCLFKPTCDQICLFEPKKASPNLFFMRNPSSCLKRAPFSTLEQTKSNVGLHKFSMLRSRLRLADTTQSFGMGMFFMILDCFICYSCIPTMRYFQSDPQS